MIAMLHFATLVVTTLFAAAAAVAFNWMLLRAMFVLMRPATARRVNAPTSPWCAGRRNWRGPTRRIGKLTACETGRGKPVQLRRECLRVSGQDSRPNVSGGVGGHLSAAAPGSEREGATPCWL